jgi:hypothetical protein
MTRASPEFMVLVIAFCSGCGELRCRLWDSCRELRGRHAGGRIWRSAPRVAVSRNTAVGNAGSVARPNYVKVTRSRAALTVLPRTRS